MEANASPWPPQTEKACLIAGLGPQDKLVKDQVWSDEPWKELDLKGCGYWVDGRME